MPLSSQERLDLISRLNRQALDPRLDPEKRKDALDRAHNLTLIEAKLNPKPH